MLQTPEKILVLLAPAAGEWETVVAETRTRPAVDHPSGEAELTDTVVVLRRIK